MALAFAVLASGSSGNCLWVRGGGVELLVDCGLSARIAERRLADVGEELGAVRALICTHGHGDHVGGAAVLARRLGVEVFATSPTLAAIPGEPPAEQLRRLPREGELCLGGLTVSTCPTPHDIPGSVCLRIDDGESSLGVVTDLGTFGDTIAHHLRELDALVLETNHDLRMLEDGPYPRHLKDRILSDRGHLSNPDSMRLLGRLAHPGLRHLTLAHLSETNNEPALARAAAEEALDRLGLRPALAVASQHRPSDPVRLRAGTRPR